MDSFVVVVVVAAVVVVATNAESIFNLNFL